MLKLSFGIGNAKLAKDTAIFSLPAGHTCPSAMLCLSRANRQTGKLADGPKNEYRCFAASTENIFPSVRLSRWRNFDALRQAGGISSMADLIEKSLPRKGITLCRVNASGDFFSQDYFDAWCMVAQWNPNIIFYAYTKQLAFWVARLNLLPANFRLTASRGGKLDYLIKPHNLRNALVVFTEGEAEKLGLPLDHDDTLAWKSQGNFALLLHGTQPAKTPAAKALYKLRKQGKGGYKTDYFGHYKKQPKG